MEHYSINDWRYFLAHKEGSKYDWSSGKNPSDYNHDYWEQHKDEILAKRRQKNGAVRDFGGAGVGYKAKKDGTTGENLSDYENDEDWSDELNNDELSNIEKHNKIVDDNIASLKKTVNDYINANRDKLTPDQINALQDDLRTQISIANEQRINTKNSDDRNYVMGLRKQSGASKAKSQSAPAQNSSRNSSSNRSNNRSNNKSNNKSQKTQPRPNTPGEQRYADAAMDEATRRYNETAASRAAYDKNKRRR